MPQQPPLYQALIDHITSKIESGEWPPGHKLPPLRELAAEFDVSMHTAWYAQSLLKDRGVLIGRQGKGVVVAGRRRQQ